MATEPKSGVHEIGDCQCGFFNDVSEIMSCRARDGFRDDKAMTVERCAHELFEEFHEIAIRDRVSDEHLRKMCMGHSEQVAMIFMMVDKLEKEGTTTENPNRLS